MTWSYPVDPYWMVALKALLVVVGLLTAFAFMTLIERRLLARFQVRMGPNRVGPFGLLQPLADAIKSIFKEDIVVAQADRFLFVLAPLISVVFALLAFGLIPFGPPGSFFGYQPWVINLDLGILYSEPGLGLALLAPGLLVGSLNLNDIVNWQKEHGWLFLYAFPAFLVYLIASMAEAARTPFDLPEAEQELVGGYHTEYSSIKWALFQMAEYIHFITASALIPTLFLGGWTMPVLEVPYLWMFLKLAFFLFFFIWIRATWFRLRYDQLLRFGWGFLFPLALLWFLVTALVVALDLPRTYLLYLSALSFLVLLGAVLYTPKPARKGGGA